MCKVLEDMRNESRAEGKAEGKAEGIKENMRATALRMLKAKEFALAKIADITGLSLEEVEKLEAHQPA